MKYLTPAEFADLLPDIGVRDKELWVKRRCRAREITHTRISRNIILIPAREVERWLASHTIEATQPDSGSALAVPGPPTEGTPVDIGSALRSRRRRTKGAS